jgi:prepilin-type N-terminal cleavage/methylation domain-containing protein
MRIPRPPRARDGFTLIEMAIVLVIVVLLGSRFISAPRPSPQKEARATALRMRAMLVAALSQAELEHGEVIVKAEAAPTGDIRGRFLALAGSVGVTPTDDPVADWIELDHGQIWRSGSATLDPMGVPTDGKVPGTIRCSAEQCETGDGAYVVYYVGHFRSPFVGWSVVLTRDREVLLFGWNPVRAAWEAGAR